MAMALHLARPCSSHASLFALENSTENTRKDRRPVRIRCGSARSHCEGSGASDAGRSDAGAELLSTSALSRREALVGGLGAALSLPSLFAVQFAAAETSGARLTDGVSKAVQVDGFNAYTYTYPVLVGKQAKKLSWIESRKPERYSSAAPLSRVLTISAADARQRIVSERLDLNNNVVVSVSVGPPNSAFLKTKDPNTWEAKDVARSVLSDKSTARMTMGQRVAEVAIVDAHKEEIDGEPYWYYEYLVQKSPTVTQGGVDVYRHSIAVTAEREGYFYSLNASTLDSRWKMMEPLFKETVSSFHLTPLTKDYVPPYKDPWRFW